MMIPNNVVSVAVDAVGSRSVDAASGALVSEASSLDAVPVHINCSRELLSCYCGHAPLTMRPDISVHISLFEHVFHSGLPNH